MELLSNHIFRQSFMPSYRYGLTEDFSYLYYQMNTDYKPDMGVLRARFVEHHLLTKHKLGKLANNYAGKIKAEVSEELELPTEFLEYEIFRKKYGNRAICISEHPMWFFTSHEIWDARARNVNVSNINERTDGAKNESDKKS